mgnify:CR=1 FL=1
MSDGEKSDDDKSTAELAAELGSIDEPQLPDYDLVDLYISYNFAEAELIQDILLDNHIDCYIHKMEASQFPMNVGKHGQIRIAVEDGKLDDAVALLEEAIEADALTGEGKFVGEEDAL